MRDGAMAQIDILMAVKRAKNSHLKNPSRAVETHPVASLDPDYPVKPWIAHTGEHFRTVSVRLDDGRYLAFILEDQNIQQTAKTRTAAEDAVKRVYPKKAQRSPRDIPYDNEEAFMDDEDYQFGEQAKRSGKFYTLEEFREQWRKRRSG
jgi:hypothetical protein